MRRLEIRRQPLSRVSDGVPTRPRKRREEAGVSRKWSNLVERTSYAAPTTVHHVGIDHGRRDIAVTEQFHGSDVEAALQQVEKLAALLRKSGQDPNKS